MTGLPTGELAAAAGDRRRMAWLAIVAGCALTVTAVPWVVASLLQAPTHGVKRALLRGVDPGAARLEAFIAARQDARGWVADATTAFDIGLARLRLAATAGDATPDGRRRLAAAAAAFERGLARAPGDSAAWMHLAEARLRRDGPSPAVAGALHMSMRTGLFLPGIMIDRLRLAALAWPHLDASARDAVEDQVRMAWRDRHLGPRVSRLVDDPALSYVLAPLVARIAAEPRGEVSVPLSP